MTQATDGLSVTAAEVRPPDEGIEAWIIDGNHAVGLRHARLRAVKLAAVDIGHGFVGADSQVGDAVREDEPHGRLHLTVEGRWCGLNGVHGFCFSLMVS
jgi:hypothetical protein